MPDSFLDIFEYCNENNEDGILVFLDFEKAFDSVEWNFLFKTLEKFNFGQNFVRWMKVLYTNPIFRLKNNGWISKSCKMSRGIRQGCPISALLYLFVAEILSLKIKDNGDIHGFKTSSMDKDIKSIHHADDLTLALKDTLSLQSALRTIHDFCLHAGSKVNLTKTECLLLGRLKDGRIELHCIKVVQTVTKCLGIYIGSDRTECFDKNWTSIYDDMQKLFESWKKRKLTIFCKKCIVNSLAISKLVYRASILTYPGDEFVKKISKLIFNFLWKSRERIKRNTLIGQITDGGIGLVDINSKFKSLKAAWVARIIENKGNLGYFINCICKECNIDMMYLVKTNERNENNYNIIKKLPLFYKEVFCAFNESKTLVPLHSLSADEFLQHTIWNNVYFKTNGSSLNYPNWIKSNILYVRDVYNEDGKFKSINDFANILVNKYNYICEYIVLKRIFATLSCKFDCKKAAYVNIKSRELFLFGDRNENIRIKKSNFYYGIFVKHKFHRPCYQSLLSRTLHIEDSACWNVIYRNKILKIQNSKVAEFNYNILNNLLYNNYIVSKWKRTVDMHCLHCKNEVENTEHLIFKCKNVQRIWKILGITLKFEIKCKHILDDFYNADNKHIDLLNFIISYVACRIYKYKMFCRIDSLQETEYNVCCSVRENMKVLYLILQNMKHKYNVKLIENFIRNL